MSFSRFSRGLLRALITLMALLLLVACISYYYLPWPIMDLLSLVVPPLWTLNLLGVFYLVRTNRLRQALLPAALLLFSLFCFGPYYRVSDTSAGQETPALVVASFNTGNHRGWAGAAGDPDPAVFSGSLERLDADIVCFQELNRSEAYRVPGYPYRHFSTNNPGKSTQAIFSRYPITGSGSIDFPDSSNNAIYADLVVGTDTIRVYNVHLQSYRIGSRRFLYRDYGSRFLSRFAAVAARHAQQAERVKTHQLASGRPALICGDFNATAFSHAYRILSGGMSDSFGEKGTGFGASYHLKGIPFRIDYILSGPAFEVIGHQVPDIRLSDHRPVRAELRLQQE